MIGSEGAAGHVAAWLATAVPVELTRIEVDLDLPAGSLPPPTDRIHTAETGPLAVEDYPSIFVLPQRTTTMTLTDPLDDGSEVYAVTYALRILAWVRSEGYVATDTLRQRYALALRRALLIRKQLAAITATTIPGDFTVKPETLREDYGPVVVDDAKRTIAGVIVDVEVRLAEVLPPPAPYGTVLTTDLTVLPAHPAL